MNNKNDVLKKYIITRYGSLSKFLKKEKFSPHHLEIVLHKNDIFYEIGIGIKICAVLNIDAERLFCHNEIIELNNDFQENNPEESLSLDEIIKEKYARLDEERRKKVLDFANYIYENGNGNL
ncbi:MAG: hypothetical protein FWF92_06875 [Oscillospiraceae bacterium]|nr:hypothetical protein [Oscillospiraceae bacterium]